MSSTPYKNYSRFLLSIDCIIFGFDGSRLKALFVERAIEPEIGKWSLMGGFLDKDESVDEGAARVLKELTGLTGIYMEQLKCYGELDRDAAGRVVSIAYFALINTESHSALLTPEHNAQWFDLDKVPHLVFDHNQMLLDAKERLRQKVARHPIGFALLPNKFTLQQLQSLYEAVFEASFDKRNFTKKILSLSILQKLDEKEKLSSRKGAFYYVFDEKKYKQLESEGLNFI